MVKMKDTSFFSKRFSVGLALDTTLDEFNELLDQYAWAIENIYFSLPMGDKFHARTRVVNQMRNPEIVELFWEILKCIRSHGVKLELVLNNGLVSTGDVREAAQLLSNHEIHVDLVGITDDIYDDVKLNFPTQEIVYSFKNHTHSKAAFASLVNCYDEIVVGRQNIRNTELFRFLRHDLHAKVVLLLNNGCSHVCGGCTTLSNCHRAYYQEKFNNSSEYLYALQSILPFELHSGLLDVSNVHLFKISSRNASVTYIRKCLDSYINCIEGPYIQQSAENYILWSRLAWHGEYYSEFSLARIKALKELIYHGSPVKSTPSRLQVTLDLRNRFLFHRMSIPNLTVLEQNLGKMFKEIPWEVGGYLVGVSSCPNLLQYIVTEQLEKLFSILGSMGREIYFSLPPLTEVVRTESSPLWHILRKWICSGEVKCLVVNDPDTEHFCQKQLGFPTAFGERMADAIVFSESNDYLNGNESDFGRNIVGAEVRERYIRDNIQFLLCTMPRDGLCISPHETIKIQTVVGLIEEYSGVCYQKHNGKCDGSCLVEPPSVLETSNKRKAVLHTGSIYQTQRISQGIWKTVLENRVRVVIPISWEELL